MGFAFDLVLVTIFEMMDNYSLNQVSEFAIGSNLGVFQIGVRREISGRRYRRY
jgi:hypothetical protein